MPEAEDVLLEAAHRVGVAAHGLWSRHVDPQAAAAATAAGERRRIDRWLVACFGRSWPLVPADPPPPASWLRRSLGDPAPWQRRPRPAAAVDGERIHLPRAWLEGHAPPDPPDLLLVASLVAGWQLHRGLERAHPSALRRDLAACLDSARAEGVLAAAFPGLRPAMVAGRQRALRARPRPQALRPAEGAAEQVVRALLARRPGEEDAGDVAAAVARAHRADRDEGEQGYRGLAPVAHWAARRPRPAPRAASAGAGGGGLPRRSLPRRVERRAPDPDEQDERPGPFVLPFTDPHLSVQDARGLERPTDQGDEDLEALAEELAQLEEAATVAGEEPVREVLESESGGEPAPGASARAVADAGEPVLRYPEWDHRRGHYVPGACALRERDAAPGPPEWAARVRAERGALLRRLRREFQALRPRPERLVRQLDGDEVDVDGWVDEWADRRAGRTPPGRVYARPVFRRRDTSVALLVDASGSTDAWVSGSSRVIDVAREAALCFCTALEALGDRHAVLAFSGCGAGDVRVWRARGFGERGATAADARLGGLGPDRSTRLGAPLRHLTSQLAREPSRRRLLLVLSDGKPDDEDHYAGAYGVEDVRQAVVEARAQGIGVFCVTIDRHGPEYLPRLFGPGGYAVIRRVEDLPARLPAIYRALTQ